MRILPTWAHAIRLAVLGVKVLVPARASADPITLTFNALTGSRLDINSIGSTYVESEFLFTAFAFPGNTPNFAFFPASNPAYTGSPTLFNQNAQGTTVLTRADGGAFDLFGLTLFEVPSLQSDGQTPLDLGLGHVTFTGVTTNGQTLTHTVTFGQFPAATQVTFSSFTDVRSVSWNQGPGGVPGPTHSFDNVVVERVPEPASALLLLIGAAVAGVTRSRER